MRRKEKDIDLVPSPPSMLAVSESSPVLRYRALCLKRQDDTFRVSICIWSTTVGALVPILAQRFGVDATGLVIYFTIAKAILGV